MQITCRSPLALPSFFPPPSPLLPAPRLGGALSRPLPLLREPPAAFPKLRLARASVPLEGSEPLLCPLQPLQFPGRLFPVGENLDDRRPVFLFQSPQGVESILHGLEAAGVELQPLAIVPQGEGNFLEHSPPLLAHPLDGGEAGGGGR